MSGGHSVGRAQLELTVGLVEHIDRAGLGAGKLRRLRDDGVEHGLQIERRIDRLADLTERAQLPDRLRELARARLHLVEQPHVLDRDHRLVGEGSDQLDLLLGKGINSGARQKQDADRSSLAEERNTERCPVVPNGYEPTQIVLRIVLNIADMNGLSFK